jgi:hypothetical protein
MPTDAVDLFGPANTRSARRAESQRTRSGALNWCDVFFRRRVRRHSSRSIPVSTPRILPRGCEFLGLIVGCWLWGGTN